MRDHVGIPCNEYFFFALVSIVALLGVGAVVERDLWVVVVDGECGWLG